MTTPSQPLVSIVVPAYNHARYLREAIDGILAQDYPHIELIVLNDGSTDDTDEVLRSYPSGRFYWETQANMGQSATLNKGWRMSRGEILAYLSADDALRPEAVSRSVAALQAHPEAVGVYCDYELISAESTVLRHVAAPEFDYFAMLQRGVCAPGPGAFFRRKAFEAAGPWNPAYRQMPDYDFWLRMGLFGTLLRVAEPLAYYRVHEQSQTFAAATAVRSEEAIQIIAELFRRSDLLPEVRAAERRAASGAKLLASQYHLRAGRYSAGIRSLASAVRIDPSKIWEPHTTRAVGSALFGRLRHSLEVRRLRGKRAA